MNDNPKIDRIKKGEGIPPLTEPNHGNTIYPGVIKVNGQHIEIYVTTNQNDKNGSQIGKARKGKKKRQYNKSKLVNEIKKKEYE